MYCGRAIWDVSHPDEPLGRAGHSSLAVRDGWRDRNSNGLSRIRHACAEVWLCLAQSFGALPGFPSGSLSDFFAQQPSSSNDQTLAHELLGLPTMSQGFSAKVRRPSADL